MDTLALADQLDALTRRVDLLERQVANHGRLGPPTETAEAQADRVRRLRQQLLDADPPERLRQQLLDADAPDVDRSKVCTTSGESPDKVRAEQTNATGQHKAYIVLCEEERRKGFVRPYRDAYRHVGHAQQLTDDEGEESHVVRIGGCGAVTTMGRALSETYARDPAFYGSTFCGGCNRHLPVSDFVWTADGQPVGS